MHLTSTLWYPLNIYFHCAQLLSQLLSNGLTHERWPSVVSDDVVRHVQKLKNKVFIVAGQVDGKTLLPKPDGVDSIDETNTAKIRLDL